MVWIIVDGSQVEHWLDGMKVVEYERGNQAWNALVDDSKYKEWPEFGTFEKGHFLLQDLGDVVFYRNSVLERGIPSLFLLL